MTERMGDEQLDREIRGFLAWQAEGVSGAPSATEMAGRISDRAGTAAAGLRVVPQLAWVLLAGLLVIALLGVLAVAANQPPPAPPLPVSYEAVFLRIEVVGDSHTVVVVGVNDEGRERQIARLPGAWAAFDISTTTDPPVYLSPTGAVSPTGLLAIPSDRGDAPLMMHWEIYDLHQPEEDPVAVAGVRHFIEDSRGGQSWGPRGAPRPRLVRRRVGLPSQWGNMCDLRRRAHRRIHDGDLAGGPRCSALGDRWIRGLCRPPRGSEQHGPPSTPRWHNGRSSARGRAAKLLSHPRRIGRRAGD
jgi:hypothetical protein